MKYDRPTDTMDLSDRRRSGVKVGSLARVSPSEQRIEAILARLTKRARSCLVLHMSS